MIKIKQKNIVCRANILIIILKMEVYAFFNWEPKAIKAMPATRA